MLSQTRKLRIHSLFARFVGEVKNANAINWYDLNRESQNFLVPCLKILFKAPALCNLDITENNFPCIDLADETVRLAFQITSDSSGKKIKETLGKFCDFGFDGKYERLIIFIIGDKQSRYTIDFPKFTPKNFIFDKSKDIFDQNDFIKTIETCSDQDQQSILNLLEENFSDNAIDNRFQYQERIENHRAVFVPPAEYQDALTILKQRGLVVLSGPPHIGKTETAYALLDEVSQEKQFSNVIYMGADWDQLFSSRRKAILIDDAFGSSTFDKRTLADRFDEIINLAKNNYIVITSRQGILDEACKINRIGQGPISNLRVDLQEGSYDYTALNLILHNHINFAQKQKMDGQKILLDFQSKKLLDNQYKIVNTLHFPHNIERLVNFHAINSEEDSEIDKLIESAKEIKLVVQQWFQNQDINTKILVLILTLLPNISENLVGKFYTQVCIDLGISKTDIRYLIRNACGYIRNSNFTINLAHPSYTEGIYVCLKDTDLDFGWEILHLLSKYSVEEDISILIQCRLAAKRISSTWDYWHNQKTPRPYMGSIEGYFSEFISSYNAIIKKNFPNIMSSFTPKWDGEACIYLAKKHDITISWSIGQKRDVIDLVNILKDQSVDFESENSWSELHSLGINHKNYYSDTILLKIPQIEAFDHIIKELMDYLRNPMKSKEKFLAESWHLQMSSLLIQLKKSGLFDIDLLNITNPLTEEYFKEKILSLIDMKNNKSVWNNRDLYGINENLTDWPTNIVINNLDVRLIVQYIDKLQKEGYLITGDFLVPPDITWDEVFRLNKPKISSADRYTDQQLIKAVENAVTLLIEAYQKTVVLSFPTFYKHLTLYRYFPIKINIVIDRESEDYFSDTSISYSMKSLKGEQSAFKSEFEIAIYLISKNMNELDKKENNKIQVDFYDKFEEHKYFRSGSFENDFVMDLEKWHKKTISLIESDLKRLLEDSFM
jgi:hypothetical protein